ncbi:hypothetical protein [uncultured Microscilla sp.]|uniref:hypothetical protein n=1 Tax=uncultured Microscilla sp. TaxID=432653 RepID=UPI00263281E5|nr:hypothetical protein [uncultured Microscilla sp.]
MRKQYGLLILCWWLTFVAQAQTKVINIQSPINGKTVSFTEFLDALEQANRLVPQDGKKYDYIVQDVKVRFVQEVDKAGMDQRFFNNGQEIVIRPDLRISKIDWDSQFWFVPRNITFAGNVYITETQRMKAIFTECRFKKALAFLSNDGDFLDFKKCDFSGGFRMQRSSLIDHLKIDSCRFDIAENLEYGVVAMGLEPRIFLIDNKANNLDLSISNTTFNVHPTKRYNPQYFVSLRNSVFSNLKLVNSHIKTSLDLQNTSISNNFQLNSTQVHDYILLFGLNINPLGTRLDWKLVEKRIAYYDVQQKKLFSIHNLKQIPLNIFNDLFSSYAIVYAAFKSQGNRYSTNQCYIEWKNVETQYLKKLYEKDRNAETYFTYWMNVFLKVFCDYGTNPLKSLYMSFYVLLVFALVYFFLPHQFGYARNNFYENLRRFSNYLRHPEEFFQVMQAKKADMSKRHSKVKDFVEGNKRNKAPFYFNLIALPDNILYQAGKASNNFVVTYMRWVHKLKNSGNQLAGGLANVLFFLLIFIIVLENLIFRALDSTALSINIFTTLGFGNTDAKGLPMYLTVLEGFIGWFLLSFFSLSLISQLIN